MRDFLSRSDEGLRAWAQAFGAQITSSPTSVGLVAADATAFTALYTDYAAKLAAVTSVLTRTRGLIAAKNASRTLLKNKARALVRIIQAFPGTTTQQRIDLDINPRDNPGTPIEAPTVKPSMEIVSADGRRFKMLVKQIGSDGKAKLPRSIGADIYSYVGTSPNPDMDLWLHQGRVSRGEFFVELSTSVPAGSQVWFRASWATMRGLNGPLSNAISAYVAGPLGASVPGVLPTSEAETPMLKAA